eukprot:TRINITY_DN43889_c0_g1_i1.p1 TRINITY_DN43889_c0_g1~~TRINITY_DN43889_c0_g1_i1.p1  ORF type:complete len:111 (-),score=14.10 TRINITY_DN43889_c0_g1_i1:2-334(-)
MRISSSLFKVQTLDVNTAWLEPEVDVTGAGNAEECEICCDNVADTVFMPCSHGGMCEGCADEVLRRANRHCVTCRQAVSQVLKIDAPHRLLQGLPTKAAPRPFPSDLAAM